MGTLDLAIIAALGFVALMLTKNPVTQVIKEITTLPPQEVTSPKGFLGFRTTGTLGLIDSKKGLTPLQTGLANLRDNLTVGGLLFQSNDTSKTDIPISPKTTSKRQTKSRSVFFS